jgi:hypothetical protein
VGGEGRVALSATSHDSALCNRIADTAHEGHTDRTLNRELGYSHLPNSEVQFHLQLKVVTSTQLSSQTSACYHCSRKQ